MKVNKQKKELGNGMLHSSDIVLFYYREEVGANIQVGKRSRRNVFNQVKRAFRHLLNALETQANPRCDFEVIVRDKDGNRKWMKQEMLYYSELEKMRPAEFIEIVNAFFESKAHVIDIRIGR